MIIQKVYLLYVRIKVQTGVVKEQTIINLTAHLSKLV